MHFSENCLLMSCLDGKLPEFREVKGMSTGILNLWHSLNPLACNKTEFPSARPSVSQAGDVLSLLKVNTQTNL